MGRPSRCNSRSKAYTTGIFLILRIVETLLQGQSTGPGPVLLGVLVIVDAGGLVVFKVLVVEVIHSRSHACSTSKLSLYDRRSLSKCCTKMLSVIVMLYLIAVTIGVRERRWVVGGF